MIEVIGTPPAGQTTWLVVLRPTRPDWPDHMTADEQRALARHFQQLTALTEAGQCVIAGPTLDAQLGVCVLDGLSVEETLRHFENDAMVVAGYFAAEVRAYKLSLERGRPR